MFNDLNLLVLKTPVDREPLDLSNPCQRGLFVHIRIFRHKEVELIIYLQKNLFLLRLLRGTTEVKKNQNYKEFIYIGSSIHI